MQNVLGYLFGSCSELSSFITPPHTPVTSSIQYIYIYIYIYILFQGLSTSTTQIKSLLIFPTPSFLRQPCRGFCPGAPTRRLVKLASRRGVAAGADLVELFASCACCQRRIVAYSVVA